MTIEVCSQNGGVGKTRISVLLAHAATRSGERVLLVDLDRQAHSGNRLRDARSTVSIRLRWLRSARTRRIGDAGVVAACCSRGSLRARVVLSGPAQAATRGPVKRAPTPSATASTLAKKLVDAGTDDTRYAAIVEAMKALRVGVYTSAGKRVVLGPEHRRADLYLYTFELRALAQGEGRGDRGTLADLAGTLARAGLRPSAGVDLPPDLLAAALEKSTASAVREPGARGALPLLLVRQLGLTHAAPQDTAMPIAADQLQLDPVQRALILMDIYAAVGAHAPAGITLETLARRPPPTGVAKKCADLQTMLEGIGKAKKDEDIATRVVRKTGSQVIGKMGKELATEIATRYPAIGKAAAWLDAAGAIAGQVLDGVHGGLLAYSIDVRPLSESVGPTHFGHGTAGAPFSLQTRVTMLDDLGDRLILCGLLAGLKFSLKGPIAGVEVAYDVGNLRTYGDVDCGLLCVAKTGADGVATVTYYPFGEVYPGLGFDTLVDGDATGVALYQTAFGSTLGKIAQFLTPKTAGFHWRVGFHEQAAFDASVTVTQTTTWSDNGQAVSPCTATNAGQGRQSFTLTSPLLHVVFITDGRGGLQVGSPTGSSIASFRATGTIDRSGSETRTPETTRSCIVASGGPGAPPPSDCGVRPFDQQFGLRDLNAVFGMPNPGYSPGGAPYQNCEHPRSEYETRLVAIASALPLALVMGDDPTITLTGTITTPEGATLTSNGYTSTYQASTVTSWTITLTRIEHLVSGMPE